MPTIVHEKLYEDALNAVNLLFSDNTVDAQQTRESLLELSGEIRIMLAALGSDLGDEAQPSSEELEEDEEEKDE